MSVFVGNLPETVQVREVRAEFQELGSCKVNYFGSFAFVEYEEVEDAYKAVERFDGLEVSGCNLRVELTSRFVQPRPALFSRLHGRSRSPKTERSSTSEVSENIQTKAPSLVPEPISSVVSDKPTSLSSTDRDESEERDSVPLLTPKPKSRKTERLSLRSSRRKVKKPQRYSPESSTKSRKASLTKSISESSDLDQIRTEDGTVFNVIGESTEGLRVVCSQCQSEINSQSIKQHLKSKLHLSFA